jgi:hypothetical protein
LRQRIAPEASGRYQAMRLLARFGLFDPASDLSGECMSSARKILTLTGAILAVLALSSCSSVKKTFSNKDNEPNVGPCPPAHALADASRLVEINGAEAYANVGYTGEVRQVRSACRYIGADPIEMQLEIDLAFGKGPSAQGDAKVYNYWVAVTRRDVVVLAKKHYSIKVEFPKGADRMAATEKVERIVIPRANADTSGANFEVLVGFDLTPEQLAFNRAGKRFRVNVGS